MTRGFLDDIVGKISEEERKKFAKHLKYRSIEHQLQMKHTKFKNHQDEEFEFGTAEFFKNLYNEAKEKIRGFATKNDDESVAKKLEYVTLKAIEISGEDAKYAAELFRRRKAAGHFGSPSDQMGELRNLLKLYLGAEDEQIEELYAALKSDKLEEVLDGIDRFSETMKDHVIQHMIGKQAAMTAQGKHHKFAAYVISELEKETGKKYKDEELGKFLSAGPGLNLRVYDEYGMLKHQEKKRGLAKED